MKDTDVELGRVALSRGWISEEALERALGVAERAQAMGLEKTLEEILADEGLLSEKQLRALKEELGWTLRRTRISHFEVLRRVGLGGTGAVFEARHVRLNVRVALKVLYPRYAQDPEFARNFLEEARKLASLNHPNLVHAVDFGVDEDCYYLATEYVDGMDLRQRLLAEGPLASLPALRIVGEVCRALEYLSSRGLVHRDIKPANILLGPGECVKLADCGLASAVRELRRREKLPCGTPHYMAPEQIVGRGPVDFRCDLYSLGATWYHLVVGRPPFVGVRDEDVLRAHVEKDPVAPSVLRREVPGSVDRTILRWLAKDPSDRPASAAQALQELDALRRELEPIGRWFGAARGRLSKRLGRPEILAGAGLLAIAFVGVALVGPFRARGGREPLSLPESLPASQEGPERGAGGPDERSMEAPRAIAEEAEESSRPPAEAISETPEESAPGAEKPPLEPALRQGMEEGGRPARKTSSLYAFARAFARGSDRLVAAAADVFQPFRSAELAASSRPLAASFHAKSLALDARTEFPRGILLRYRFDEAEELRDFRFAPGRFSLTGGGLRAAGGSGPSEMFSVAWFVPPLRVEVLLPAPAALGVGLGALRLAPGRDGEMRLWREDVRGERPELIPPSPAGTVVVEWSAHGVRVFQGGAVYLLDAPVPEAGRLFLELGPGDAIEALEIDGWLEPTWGAKRLEALREREQVED